MLNEYIDWTTHFLREHHVWAPVLVGLLAFGESLAVISLLVPATGLLIAIGAMMGAANIDYWSVMVCAVIGAGLGDWLSYWFGRHYGQGIKQMRLFRSRPEIIAVGELFFARWGIAGVFIGRFSGPLRASVPLVAGILKMPVLKFQLANWSSAMIWAPALLSGGAETVKLMKHLLS